MLTRKFFFSVVIYILISIPIAFGQQLTVAAAANLQAVMPILQADFKKRTGISADIIIGSSGKLVAQISNGAPYDVFLSADMELPEKLYKDGATLAKPVIYATGSLIICSINKKSLTNWQQVLTDPQVKKIAIANPSVAPYGAAAMEALEKAGILQKIKSKLVYGESIAQVNTYITTGVVDAGFTAESLLKETTGKLKLHWQPVDPKTYQPVKQGMVIINRAGNNTAAKKFYQYILSPAAKRIFKNHSYK